MIENRKYSTDDIIKALELHRGLISRAAQALGTKPSVIYYRKSKGRDAKKIQQALDEIRGRWLDEAEATVLDNMQDVEVAKWYLSKLGAERGYRDAPQGNTVNNNITVGLPALLTDHPIE